jgi:hypothetical protein
VSDRALQDRLIRALADAPYRGSAEWEGQALADPERVERFARFLARHFYHERVVHFFKYSRALSPTTGRRPEAVLTEPAFDALLPTAVLGSRRTARAVADLVVARVLDGGPPASVPYLDDLLRYEGSMMVVEAGPRVWRDGSGMRDAGHGMREAPTTVEGTVVLELRYDLPAVLPLLLRPWTTPPQPAKRPTPLLIARSAHGRVAVARSGRDVAAVLRLADGTRTVGELAAAAGLDGGALARTLADLVELGAVRFSTGS